MASAPALSTNTEFAAAEIVHRANRPSNETLHKVYHLEALIQALNEAADKKSIALQFPDDLLPDSIAVEQVIRKGLQGDDRRVFILADTSYSACCVDEVAAEHLNADVLVHFGNTCLNPVRSLPVIYVFGGYDYQLSKICDKIVSSFGSQDHILLMSDPHFSLLTNAIYERLSPAFPNMVSTYFHQNASQVQENAVFIPSGVLHISNDQSELPTRLPSQPLKTKLSEYLGLYITHDSASPSLILHLSTLMSSVQLLSLKTLQITQPQALLQKRYRFMSMARTATTVGILVNTLSIRGVNALVSKIQDWITQAGKKYYTFVVGKPNVPKLANFEVVDVWVVVGCPLGGLIIDHSNEFYRPAITPYEMNLALQPELTWPGNWTVDFAEVLDMHVDNHDPEENDRPEFDSVRGVYVSNSRPLNRLQHIDVEAEPVLVPKNASIDVNVLTRKLPSQLAIRNTISTAAEHLHQMSWRGLGSDWDPADDHSSQGAVVEQGRDGISRGYRVNEDENRT